MPHDLLGQITVKAIQDPEDALRFVVTDGQTDRIGDQIEVKGWSFDSFRRNNIALYQHDHEMPIGTWEDLKVDGGQVSARLQLAAPGTSAFIDTVRSLVQQRILKAASVGFMPLEMEARDKDNPRKGYKFTKAELLEISLVSVPANDRALAIAKSLSLADRQRLFVEPDIPEPPVATSGAPAAMPASIRVKAMSTAVIPAGGVRPNYGQAIVFKEQQLNGYTDELVPLTAEYAQLDDDEIERKADLGQRIDALNAAIAQSEQDLERLKASEQSLAKRAVEPAGKTTIYRPGAAMPMPAIRRAKPDVDLVFKTMATMIKSRDQMISPERGLEDFYPGRDDLREFIKAGVSPALTTVAGWAAELVQQSYGQFLELFVGTSVFPRISANTITFDRTGKIVYPVEASASPDIAGSFVGELLPIPVRKGALTSLTLMPYKMGVITTWSCEIANQSTPAIEAILRDMVVRRTRKAIDTALLDNTAMVTNVRPAGLQTYATGANTAASTGTSAQNMLTDIRGRITQITSLDMGQRLQWVMHPSRLLGLSYVVNTQGTFQFPNIEANQTLAGYPIVVSTNVPPTIVFLIDTASVVFAIAPAPELRIDDTATVHMEDTAPKQIVPGPALPPGTAAPAVIGDIPTPVMSFFQTGTWGLRLIWDMSWGVARTGAVQTITGCNW